MANFATYRHKDYSLGLNNTSSKRDISRGQASLLQNWDITFQGRLKTRKGLTQYGDTLADTVGRLGFYQKDDGNNYLLTHQDTDLMYLNSATWTNINTGYTAENLSFQDVASQNEIYISSENNVLSHWDGSTLTQLGAGIPHGNKIIWYQNHMMTLNNVNISGTKYKNRLYISNFGDPNTWTTGTDFVELEGLGDAVTAEIVGDALVVFKDESYMILSGYGLSSWVISGSNNPLTNIDSSVGCPAVRGTVRVTQNEVWFIDQKGNIRKIYGTDYGYGSTVVSNNIQGTIDTINLSYIQNAVAHYADEKVYFAVPTGASTENNTVLVYDMKAHSRTNKEAWTTYTGWKISDMINFPVSSDPEVIIAGGSNDKVYRHTGTTDDSTAIECRWDSRLDEYDKPERYKKYTYGYLYSENQGDIDVTVHASIDGISFSQLSTFNLQGGGSTLGPTGTATMGPSGSFILGGSEDLEHKFYFYDGGAITGKTVAMSLRCSASDAAYVNTFTNHFVERSLK